MSAIVVCGNKRSFFEDLPTSSPPISASSASKRLRCSSTSPIRFSPPPPPPAIPSPSSSDLHRLSALDHLRSIFPDMDNQHIERALDECGNDLESAIKSLNQLRLGSIDNNLDSVVDIRTSVEPLQAVVTDNGVAAPSEEPSDFENLPKDGPEWVEVLVREMANSSDVDDARTRALRVLEVLEKSICARAKAETAQNFQLSFCPNIDGDIHPQENMMLKEQLESLIRENGILKRAVSIQHERQKEYEDRGQELQHLKQLVSQYQEQLRTLEVNNYALTLHLKQAQQSNSIPGRFHPDVF
ncbi:hypothetical protein Syun_011147 [Stephania yunnanensis]|uniref:CUE domain-containing protein n=1 Tax=Stephania yunnanensis TaxID=152371 RepID=A0AAP0JX03_9MAGN